jgi:predicted SprT family Zn-dependent metalloprotease
VTYGYAVSIIEDSFAIVNVNDRRAFDDAIHMCTVKFPFAYAIGTWVDGDSIHIDPAMVADNESTARTVAIANHQLAYYIIHEQREVRL